MLQQTITHSVNQSVNQAMRTVSARPCGAVHAHASFSTTGIGVLIDPLGAEDVKNARGSWQFSRKVQLAPYDQYPSCTL